MEIIFILTYNCNFRCKYCDIYKHNNSISRDIIDKSILFLEKNNIQIDKVKFFGGEPLLEKESIKFLVNNFPSKYSPKFYITTNSILIDDSFFDFIKNNQINLTFSLDGDIKTTNINRLLVDGGSVGEKITNNVEQYGKYIGVNQVITSFSAKYFFNNFLFIYKLGVRKFNFLPAYYVNWSKEGLFKLKEGFDAIYDFYKMGNPLKIVNLDNYSEISFFNFGIIIDTDGAIYGTNLILSGRFEKYKKSLKIGDINFGLYVDLNDINWKKLYFEKINSIIKIEYSVSVLTSVKYVDILLSNFCKNVAQGK